MLNYFMFLCFYGNSDYSVFGDFFSSTGRKVDDPEQLEAIRLTIINNMIEFHPVALQFQPSYIGCLLRVPLWYLLFAASSYCIISAAGI